MGKKLKIFVDKTYVDLLWRHCIGVGTWEAKRLRRHTDVRR